MIRYYWLRILWKLQAEIQNHNFKQPLHNFDFLFPYVFRKIWNKQREWMTYGKP